jgi:hypothetical protein
MARPFEGFRVNGLTLVLAGPFATSQLAILAPTAFAPRACDYERAGINACAQLKAYFIPTTMDWSAVSSSAHTRSNPVSLIQAKHSEAE